MQQKLERYPFSVISSQGLGTSNSSLDKIGSLLPLKGCGAAGIKFFPNISTGNLVVKDRFLSIDEISGSIELSYIYNSQAEDVSKLWQFTHKKFTAISQQDLTAILQECDGHQTTYTLDKNTGFYFAPACSGKGTPCLKFDDQKKQWIWYQPGKNIKEYYDTQGYLLKRVDMQGRVLNYEYDSDNNLCAIVGQSGSRYEIRRSDKTVSIYLTGKNLEEQLLQQYQFDDLGRLVCSQTVDGYKTEYDYGPPEDSWQLINIQQSDQSLLQFKYDNTKKLSSFSLGKENNYDIKYADSLNSKVIIQREDNSITQIGLDTQANITDISRSQGYDEVNLSYDTIAYSYTSAGQLESITKADQSQEKFSYQNITGLLQSHIQANGQKIEKIYQQEADKVFLINKIQYEDDELLITQYIYDVNYDNNHNIFQRFKITPESRVTEYRPDKNGNIASKREYLSSKIDISTKDSHTSPSLDEMLNWISTQDPQHTNLTEYGYNDRGQRIRTRCYANNDKQGNGIIDDQMGEEIIYPNLYGNWFTRQVKQDNNNIAVSKQTFDGLQRLTSETDALNQATVFQYNDAQSQIQMTYPNGKIKIFQKDNKDKIIQKKETVGLQTRTTQYDRDTAGRVAVTIGPDGQEIYSFYDHQDRLGFTVSASGIVTEYQYDLKNCCNTQIQYADRVDPKQLFLSYPPQPGSLPVVSKLKNLLNNIQNLSKDRISYQFFDESERIIYSVDADKIATQYFYNKRNLKTTEITYETELTDVQLKQLTSGHQINLTPDFIKDKSTRYFYDKDNYLIAKQDSGGYITEYGRDNAGKVKQKTLYDNKVPLDLEIQDFKGQCRFVWVNFSN